MSTEPQRAARRALDPAEEFDTSDVIEATTKAPSRRARGRLSRNAIAAIAAGSICATGIFGWAWVSRSHDAASSSDAIASDAAVPAAAASAVENGFGQQDTSRNALRNNLGSASADDAAKEHQESVDSGYESATDAIANETAAEREAKMDADLEKVAAQEEKIKAEKAAAAERLAQAEKALKEKGVDTSKISEKDKEAASSGGGALPLKRGTFRVGPGFGKTGIWARYHTGQDFGASIGTPIYAAASGIVISPTSGGWAGNNVVISHANGGSTLYAHMSKKVAQPGDAVKAGDLIGYVGATGNVTGPHLHFEYYPKGTTPGKVYEATNPIAFLESLGVSV